MIGQPYNPDNCAFVTNQALNTNQFNGNVPYSSNNTTHLVLWDFVDNKLLWVNSQNNVIESEIGGADLPTNAGNLVVNESGVVQSTLVREYTNGENVILPLQTHTGTTTETIVGSIFIPANTYKIGDYWDTKSGLAEFIYSYSVQFSTLTTRSYFNTSLSLSGAILSNTVVDAGGDGQNTGGFSLNGKNNMKFTSNNTLTGNGIDTTVYPFVYFDVNTPIFDITQDAYFIVTFELSSIAGKAALSNLYTTKIFNSQKLVP